MESVYPEHRWPTKAEGLVAMVAANALLPHPSEALLPPVHGKGGWTLAKYEWRKDGTGRFLYVRNNGERREVIRAQKGWCA